MAGLFGVIGGIHQRNQERRENIANAVLHREKKQQQQASSSNSDSEAEDSDESKASKEKPEPKREGFHPFGFLGGHGQENKKNKNKKKLEPDQLPRALFALGVSLVDVSVETGASGEGHGMLGFATFIPPVRHALYANSIMSGYTNFLAGATYAAYSQVKTYQNQPRKGLLAPVDGAGTMMGVCVQGLIYGGYILCMPGVLAYKLAMISNKNQ